MKNIFLKKSIIYFVLSIVIFSMAIFKFSTEYIKEEKNMLFSTNGYFTPNNIIDYNWSFDGDTPFGGQKIPEDNLDNIRLTAKVNTQSRKEIDLVFTSPSGKVYRKKGRNINIDKSIPAEKGIWNLKLEGEKPEKGEFSVKVTLK